METKIINNREVYINEDGNVIFDVDGKKYLFIKRMAYGTMYRDGIHRNTLETVKS